MFLKQISFASCVSFLVVRRKIHKSLMKRSLTYVQHSLNKFLMRRQRSNVVHRIFL